MDRRFLTVLGVSLVFALVVSSVFYQMTAHSGSTAKTDTDQSKGPGGGHSSAGRGRDGPRIGREDREDERRRISQGRVHESRRCAGASGDLEHPAR